MARKGCVAWAKELQAGSGCSRAAGDDAGAAAASGSCCACVLGPAATGAVCCCVMICVRSSWGACLGRTGTMMTELAAAACLCAAV
jgi:hypothetical protein